MSSRIDAGVDWRGGVEITTSPDSGVFVWSLCGDAGQLADGTAINEKPVGAVGTGYKFFPTFAEKIVGCHVSGSQSAIGDIVRDTARGSLGRMTGLILAGTLHGELATADQEGTAGASLASNITFPTGYDMGSPVGIRAALSALLEQVCSCFHSDPVLHIPREFMPYFFDIIVKWDEATGTFRFGPHLVSFDCYPNTDPTGANATSAGEVWIFATAQPMIGVAEQDDVRVISHRLNNYKALAERNMIIAFDPTCIGAVKATVN